MTDFQWRSIELADIESWLTLLEAIEAVDQEHEHYSVDQLREWLTDPDIDRERGTVGVWDGDRMVGYARLRCRSAATDEHLMFAQGAVHPEYRGRGLGGALLRWQEEHAPALHRARYPELPLKLYGASKQGQEDSTALYKAYGFEVGRWFFDMVCDLTTAQLPGDQLPEGVASVPFAAERRADGLAVRNDSFRDHWGSTPATEASWEHSTSGSASRPELSRIAYDDATGEALAIVLAEEYEQGPGAPGRELYIALVGTRRAARKRGIASALLTEVLRAGQAEGYALSSLGVDADSPTGALGLYQRLGYTPRETWLSQLKPVAF
ncbi:GNAT family N-acetyltransferase [Streptacidiphilus monticola]|uniref:GNAT family N-acetyltransferase n=1 Tax=Streptacidiphilus monticola TaxID=2161674 RepID=A0ABW1G8Q5_9ACTN